MRGAKLTPGVSFLLGLVPTVTVPPVLVYLALSFLSSRYRHHGLALQYLDTPLRRIFSTAVILSLYAFLKSASRSIARRNDRRSLGYDVVEAPRLKTKLPWNVDFIQEGIQARRREYIGDAFLKYFETLGTTFNLGLFGADQLFTCDPECIKAVLSTEFNTFEKGDVFKAKMNSVLGVGVFNSDGQMWQLHRSMTRPYFHRERVTHVDLFAQHSDLAISRLLSRLAERNSPAVDVQDLVGRFTLDSATEFLFGTSTHTLDAPLPYPHEPPRDESSTFAAAFNRAQEQLVLRFGLAKLWPLFEIREDKTEQSMRVINAFTDPILEERLRMKREGKLKDKEEGDTFLDHLVGCTDDEVVIKDELLNILIAGRDTASHLFLAQTRL
ncbi:cytochrome P450 family protein [Ceratobasidium sp. AG-Ba]|nr:cytochrome P450 family protein [Ceratobasidium sp. AG-Ba]